MNKKEISKSKKKTIKGFKKTPEMKEKIEEVNMWIEDNGWKKILPDDDIWQYEPISKYKKQLGIGAVKSNQILEKLGLIIREDKNKDKNGNSKQQIIITEEGRKFGRQMIRLIIIPKEEIYILKAEKYIVWSSEIVKEIKNYLAKGEENNGDTKSKNGKI